MVAKKKRRTARRDLSHISRELRRLARPMARLRPDPDNARVHDERNLEAIRASLEAHGQQKPIVLQPDGKTVAAGSGTLLAARSLGWKWIAAIRYDRDPDGVAAFAVTDNRSAELATWDEASLVRLFRHYDEVEGGRAMLPGWSVDDVNALYAADEPDTTEDDALAPPTDPVSVRGEVYELGRHRVLCGDSTARQAVAAFLEGNVPALMVTDPPYGVALDQGWRDRIGINRLGQAQDDRLVGDEGFDWLPALGIVPCIVAYVWHPGSLAPVTYEALLAFGFEVKQQIVWVKTMAPMSRSAYHWKHEPCWYVVRSGKGANWIGGRKQTTVWEVASPKHIMGGSDETKQDHPTQKPVEIMARPIRNHKGDVYDPFLGSGTTLIAAEQLGRTCYGVEIEPRYVDVVRQRYANFVRDAAYSPTGTLDV